MGARLCPALKAVQGPRVVGHDLVPDAIRQPDRQRHVRRIEVPMGIVSREHESVAHAELIEELVKVLRLCRLFYRLSGDPDVLSNVV